MAAQSWGIVFRMMLYGCHVAMASHGLELRVEEGAAQHLQVVGAHQAVQVVLAAGGRVGLVDGRDSDGAGLAQQQQRVAVQAVAKGGAGGTEGLGDVAAVHVAVGNVGHQPDEGSGEGQGRHMCKSTTAYAYKL